MLRYLRHHTLVRCFNSGARVPLGATLAALATLFVFTVTFRAGQPTVRFLYANYGKALEARNDIIASARAYIDTPLPTSAFGEMGNKTKMLTDWMEEAASLRRHLSRKETALLTGKLEDVVVSMYPFIKNPMDPDDPLPLRRSARTSSRAQEGL